MPRAKRTLAEADATASQPTSKKASKRSATAAEKENFTTKTNAELTSMLKDQGLPHNGNKAQKVERLQQSSSGQADANDKPEPVSTKTATDEIEYMTICRPFDDIKAEKWAADKKYDYEEAEDINSCGSKSCMCKKPVKDHPDWKFIISKKGFDAVKHFRKEALNRDQDYFGEYHYNDFSGYGFQEAVNNEIQAFQNEYTKKNADPYALWYRITGLAHCLPGSGAWVCCDDSQQIAETLELIGYAILAAMVTLEKNGLLTAESKIKDLSLVLAMCIRMVDEWELMEDELEWRVPMINKAEANGIKLSGPFGIEDRVAKLKEEYEDEAGDFDNFNWKTKFTEFADKYSTGKKGKIGGTHYDLSKPVKSKMIMHVSEFGMF